MNMEIIRHIASVPLFEGLSEEQQEELAMIVTDQVFKRGQSIFSEGDEGTGFYVVITGKVKIFKLSFEGKEQILHLFGPGEPFAEAANAEAVEESRVFFFPRDSFVDLIKKNTSIALSMLAVLSLRLRRFTHLIDDLSLKEVPGRLSAYLIYLSEQEERAIDLELTITKSQLASLLGTIPETLSRIFNKMSKQGYIELEGPRIKIIDREGLEDLAETGGRL